MHNIHVETDSLYLLDSWIRAVKANIQCQVADQQKCRYILVLIPFFMQKNLWAVVLAICFELKIYEQTMSYFKVQT